MISKQFLIHFAISLALGFLAAVLSCLGKAHGFQTSCLFEGLTWMGGVMGAYFLLLRQNWPGMVQLPMSHPAVQAAKRSVADAKSDLFGTGD